MTKQKKKHIKKLHLSLGIASIIVAVLVGIVVGGLYYFKDKIYPGVFVGSVYVGGLTQSQAEETLKESLVPPQTGSLTLIVQKKDKEFAFDIPLANLKPTFDYKELSIEAYSKGRGTGLVYQLHEMITLIANKKTIQVKAIVDESFLDEYLSIVASQTTNETILPKIVITQGEVLIESGVNGEDFDSGEAKKLILESISSMKLSPSRVSLKEVNTTLTNEEHERALARGKSILNKTMILFFEDKSYKKSSQEVAKLIDPKGDYYEKDIKNLVDDLAGNIDRLAQNPLFRFENGKVTEFAPALDGIETKKQELVKMIVSALFSLETEPETTEIRVEIPVDRAPTSLTISDVNNFGIKELIGKGTSTYRGSITSRVYNIAHASSKVTGVMVAPGETFSFNNAVGDISQLTGFKQAYVIQDGKTVLGDGGGVCQVSTTLFRAVMDAGLPITERRAHSYRVGYYEQDAPAGMDATVYSPTTDFKFVNDTGNHILIQATADSRNTRLTFEIYGTNDGRVSEITRPVISDVTAPPDDLYVDDPTLKVGEVKQVEHKAWGAKSRFNYTVTKDGKKIYEKVFVSTYRPWQAVYMRGVGI